jgi:hypothetical protein
MADISPSPTETPQVLTEIQAGEGLALSAAGRLFPAHRGNGTLDPSTIFRWVTRGSRSAEGRVVKLEGVRVGGRWLTSRGAVTRFVAALTGAMDLTATTSTPSPQTPAARLLAAERATAALKKLGA